MTKGAELLAAWLESRGLTLGEAQWDLRVSKQLLSRYLRGEGLPGLDKAVRLRDAAGIPVDAWMEPSAERPAQGG